MNRKSDFANMGKALLIQALGVQGNYKEEVIGIDKDASGCHSCPYSLSNDSTHCDSCPNRVLLKKQRYINEKNRYGHLPVLSLNPLKMLIHLHFLKPNEDGVVSNVSLRELSDTLGVSLRTITNNMDVLRQYGYIEFSSNYNGKRSILIKNYNDAFKTKEQYGHGYVVIPASLHDEVINMGDVNDIRITMRAYLDIDNNNTRQGGFYFNVIKKSFKQIMHELPRTITKGHVLSLLKANPVFSFSREDGIARLAIKESYVGKKLLRSGLKEATDTIRQLIDEFNTYIDFANSLRTSERTPEMSYSRTLMGEEYHRRKYKEVYKPLFERCEPAQRCELYHSFSLDDKEVENTARLSMYYGYEIIRKALEYIYVSYVSVGERIKNLGGLIRTTVSKIECESELIALQ